MIVLLGSTGYIGQAFEKALQERGGDFVSLSRKQFDYTDLSVLRKFLEKNRATFLINAAGYTGKPNVDACEKNWADTLQGNTLFPTTVAQACAALGIPFGHVSSGCIYAGAKIAENGCVRIEKDLTKPELKGLRERNPTAIHGFSETDEPNFTFRQPPCSFYSGSKALGEEAIKAVGQNYIWRLRIPFDEFDNGRNYLSKIQNYPKVYDNVNSLSHRGDFVRACLDLWEKHAPFGIYNVTNPGSVTTRQVVNLVTEILKPSRTFEFWSSDEEFYRVAAKTPRSNCVLDVSKLLATGVKLRPAEEAIVESLHRWTASQA
jgi:dTDP-4-dehydrorhamnose reductase